MNTDFLIIGQGIAGTLLSHFLLEKGAEVHVIDNAHREAASTIAAGLINPVTGRRLVKSWRIEEFLPVAQNTYKRLEEQLGISFFQKRHVLRLMTTAEEENYWQSRCGLDDYANFLEPRAELGKWKDKVRADTYSYVGKIRQSATTDLSLLIKTYKKCLQKENRLTTELFDHKKLKIHDSHVVYKDIKARKIIFCEGHTARFNPFFNYLPFNVAKGEVLVIQIPGEQPLDILKSKIILIPQQQNLYWVGSTYEWEDLSPQPTSSGKTQLKNKLNEVLNVSFQIVRHYAAIRPTTKDRRPFLGLHPDHPALAIFNGLGTKGASLAPFWAKHMAEFLCDGKPIDNKVDIQRFMYQKGVFG